MTSIRTTTRRALLSTWMAFFLTGALSAGWTVRIPAVKAKLGLSDGQLGLEVLGWGLAALLAMQVAGRLITRFGSRRVLAVVVPGVALSLVPVGLAPSFPALIAAGALFGLLFGVLEVAMNAQATLIQSRLPRSILGRMHAGWSIGAVVGGLLGALAAHLGADFTTAMMIFAAAGVLVALPLSRGYLSDEQPTTRRSGGRSGRPAPVITLLGGILFCVFLAEGAVADWGGILLHDHLGATQALAALAYPLFEGVIAVGRLLGERFGERFPLPAMLSIAGCGTALSIGLVTVAPHPVVALIGFALAGLTLCLAGPTILTFAGKDRQTAPAAIARVSTFGYSGLLIGPVVIGGLSDISSLPVGFGVVVLACLVWAVMARRIDRTGPHRRRVISRTETGGAAHGPPILPPTPHHGRPS